MKDPQEFPCHNCLNMNLSVPCHHSEKLLIGTIITPLTYHCHTTFAIIEIAFHNEQVKPPRNLKGIQAYKASNGPTVLINPIPTKMKSIEAPRKACRGPAIVPHFGVEFLRSRMYPF